MGFRRGKKIALVVALAGAVLAGNAARAISSPANQPPYIPHWDSASAPLAAGDDLSEALRLEQVVDWHLWYRQAYEIEYADTTRTPGTDNADPAQRYLGVAKLTDTTDSALWTGTYLASQAFRYQVAQHYLAGALPAGDRTFWQGQKDEALSRIRPLLDQYHLLSNISQEWKAPPPHVPSDPQPYPNEVDTGVAPFPGGQPGLLFRACAPDGVSRFPWPYTVNADGSRKFQKDTVYGPFPWVEPGSLPGTQPTQYYCEDGTSRDAYAGATFGMLQAFDLIDPADLVVTRPDGEVQNLHQQVGNDLMLLTQFLVDNGFGTPRPHSKISTSNDLSSFYSPLFDYDPVARQHMLQLAKHVADQMGSAVQKAEFDGLWEEEMATDSKGGSVGNELDASDPTGSYYKWNLDHLIEYDTINLEHDPTWKRDLQMAYATMDATTGDDVNAHFETISYALKGDPALRDAAILHLRQWRDYRYKQDHPTAAQLAANVYAVDNTAAVCDPPGPPGCKPDSETTTYFGSVRNPAQDTRCDSTTQATNGPCRAVNPIPVADRTPTDFLWQRSSFQLSGGRSALHESQGFDYLLPYWMLRYYTEVAPPTLDPGFPTWMGPHFS
jgi:hypothetical protein